MREGAIQNSEILKYLEPAFVSKLKTLELKAKAVVEGYMVGRHKSPYHGFSAEFSEHRQYIQGEALKNIDWKVFGRTGKLYSKRYEEETNLISHIILDISKSMDYKYSAEITKLEYSKILAAAFANIMLNQQDATGLITYSSIPHSYLLPKSQKIHFQLILNELEKLQIGDTTNTASALEKISHKIKRRGLILIISDFFDNPDLILQSLKQFRIKNEVILFQILDRSEVDFNFKKDTLFIDKESGEKILTQPIQIKAAYQKAISEYIEKLKSECLNNKIEYNLIFTDENFDKAIFAYFKKRGRLK